MNEKLLPKKLCNNLLNEMLLIMNLIEGTPEIRIGYDTVIDENFIDQSFEHALKNVK